MDNSVPLEQIIKDDITGIFVGDVKIRKTNENPPRISIHDLIEVVTGQKDRHIWDRMKIQYPEVVAQNHTFKFPGRGQNNTPVTDAKGVVVIINLLPGQKAAQFRLQYADVIVRYLGGDLSLIDEIQRNNEIQQELEEDNPVRLFGEHVKSSQPFPLISATNVVDLRSAQFYMRMVEGNWANICPIGKPELTVSQDELDKCIIIKFGEQCDNTGRQTQHNNKFKNSRVLDSFLTTSHSIVEQKAKDYWINNQELYEGLYEGKNVKDTELLLIKSQEHYEEYVRYVQKVIREVESPLTDSHELKLAQEKTKQMEVELEIRKLDLQHNTTKPPSAPSKKVKESFDTIVPSATTVPTTQLIKDLQEYIQEKCEYQKRNSTFRISSEEMYQSFLNWRDNKHGIVVPTDKNEFKRYINEITGNLKVPKIRINDHKIHGWYGLKFK